MKLLWWKPIYIGGKENPYMIRWFIIPRNPWFNVYLHNFKRSDDDRALHDHPWWSISVMLWGYYIEHYYNKSGQIVKRAFKIFDIKYRNSEFAHRIEIGDMSVWTIFITGPRVREWGFHCPQGWRHWKEFTAGKHGEQIGRGCD